MTMNTTEERLWQEFMEYTEEHRLNRYERRLLRDWVRSGHSVYETVESRYLPGPAYPPMDFIDAYRLDHELREDMLGMTKDEKTNYLKAVMGYEGSSPEHIAMDEAKKSAPELMADHIRQLERDLFHLWEFVCREGFTEEAGEYIAERRNEAIPFEW